MIIPIRGNVGVTPESCTDEQLELMFLCCERIVQSPTLYPDFWGACLQAINAELVRRAR